MGVGIIVKSAPPSSLYKTSYIPYKITQGRTLSRQGLRFKANFDYLMSKYTESTLQISWTHIEDVPKYPPFHLNLP